MLIYRVLGYRMGLNKSKISRKFKKLFFIIFLVIISIVSCDNSTKSSNNIDTGEGYEWVAGEYNINCVPSPTGKGGDMCFVPKGEFKHGCNEAIDDECIVIEYPFHWKMLESFWVDKYEVTIENFQKCVNAGVCNNNDEGFPHYDEYRVKRVYEGEDLYTKCNLNDPEKSGHPMNCVTWYGAEAYCEWVGKRLPTEAEWEKAARGTDGRKYPWGNEDISCEYAVYTEGDNSCEIRDTQPVGSKEKGISPYGCYDLSGNVGEWTSEELDYYRPDEDDIIYDYPDSKILYSYEILPEMVYRGGGFKYEKRLFRCSVRALMGVESLHYNVGFRCVKNGDN